MSGNHFDRLTLESKKILKSAQGIAKDLGVSVGTEHILLAIVSFSGSFASDILRGHGVTAEKVHLVLSFARFREKTIKGDITDEAKNLIEKTYVQAAKLKSDSVTPEHLLYAITALAKCAAHQILEEIGVDIEQVKRQISSALSHEEKKEGPASYENDLDELTNDFLLKGLQPGKFMLPGLGVEQGAAKKTLDTFTVDLTVKAQQGKLDPIIGRDKEIARVIQILNRRTKNNPVLIGEPGVGKTAIVEGLAQRIVEGKVPDKLTDKKILGLDLALMIAGTKYRGEFEERIKKVLEEIVKNKKVILFLDELHTIVGAGAAEGAMDAANILKPALSRGDIRLIGATTTDDYRKYVEKDAALERRLQGVKVDEPSVEDTIKILQGLKERYEKHHQVNISPEAVEAAVTLSKRFISDRYLPDKAVDLLDEASSMVSLSTPSEKTLSLALKKDLITKERAKEEAILVEDFELAARIKEDQEKILERIKKIKKQEMPQDLTVTKYHIAKVVSDWTAIPLSNLIRDEKKKFIDLEKILSRRIIGQDEAIKAIAQSIRRTRTGVVSPKRPIGSFIFMGPTGVGKTELAKVLAEEVFESEDALVKIDMSEFMERHNVSRLIGAPPGYVGYEEAGKLTEAVRKRPYSVVLLDEVEKAHPEVQNILLQILEDGYLTDARGRRVNFRNTIIIMTSNIGMRELSQEAAIGFKQIRKDKKDFLRHYEQMKEKVLKNLKEYFRPEFLNRVDKVIVFKPLDEKATLNIVVLQLSELSARLTEPKVELRATDEAKKLIAEKGFDPENGARPIRRAISDLVEDQLAQMILDGEIKDGDRVEILAKDNKVKLQKI